MPDNQGREIKINFEPGLSSNWNSRVHDDGAAMVDEIAELGFKHIECGHGLNEVQVKGIKKRVAEGVVAVSSVHAYCPNPAGSFGRGPEFVSPSLPFNLARREACELTRRSLETAVALGAAAVVLHSGRIPMRVISRELRAMTRLGWGGSCLYRWRQTRLLSLREKRAAGPINHLLRSLDQLLPHFESAGVSLCLEVLPEWESIPTESEWLMLHQRYPTRALRYWHDFGHAHIRENLGFGFQRAWLERVLPMCAGAHIHTNGGLYDSHDLPPAGGIRFSDFSFVARSGIITVMEPAPGIPAAELLKSADYLRKTWSEGQVSARVPAR